MSQELKNVIIVGASGNLGPSIVQALSNDPTFTVSVLARHGSTATFPPHIKVRKVNESWPEDELVDALKGQDAIVQILLPTDIQKHKTLIDAAVKAGVKRYIPSEFGIDTDNDIIVKANPRFALKREVADYLRSKEENGLTWTALVTGIFFDWGIKRSHLGYDLESHTATIYNGGDNYVNFSNFSTIGLATASILKNPDKTANKYLYIRSFVASQNEILAALERSTGKKWTTTAASTEELGKEGHERLGKGDWKGIPALILAAIYSGNPVLDYTTSRELQNEELGLPKETLDETVEKIVKGEEV